ncbi:chorismate mutase [Candidatus Pacearchaeota archaeon]|nr:chorismate mutase [Candidatus Pacearchaeota archaeon]
MDLSELRKKLDETDYKILESLASRFNIVKEIGKLKKEQSIKVQDKKREEFTINDRTQKLESLGYYDPLFVSELFNLIMKKSREIQND